MVSTSDLRKGIAIELDGELWQILDYHHIKMGRGSAQVRIKLRNVKRGQTVERSFQAGEKWPRAYLEQRQVQFMYRGRTFIGECEDRGPFIAGRIIDRADAAALLRANRASLDLVYLLRWIGELDLVSEMAEVWNEAFPGEPLPVE